MENKQKQDKERKEVKAEIEKKKKKLFQNLPEKNRIKVQQQKRLSNQSKHSIQGKQPISCEVEGNEPIRRHYCR